MSTHGKQQGSAPVGNTASPFPRKMQSSSDDETLLPVEKSTPSAGGSHILLDDQYHHEPLITKDAVRILVLEAADDFESPLRCSIIQRRRDSQSCSASGCEYSAVSYTWGDCQLSHQLFVMVDAQSWACLRITASVDSLLRHFRVPYKPRRLWIDAICLNQKDETEKTQQIPLMGRIYSDAKRVHIWLGDEEVEKAQQAFTIIRQTEHERKWKVGGPEMQCLATFFNRRWFTRRWVIQEAVFSHDAIFRCGAHMLSLSRLMAALMKANVNLNSLGYGSGMLFSSMRSLQEPKKELLSLLWDLHESDCSDPRDRIAAIYSLATEDGKPLLHYGSKDWKETYTHLAYHYFNHSQYTSHVMLLHLCEFGPIKSERGSLCPPWIPDWSTRRGDLRPYSSTDSHSALYTSKSRELRRNYSKWSHNYIPDMEKRTVWRQRYNAPMKFEASWQRLRITYHPLFFFQESGVADLVIHATASRNVWQEVVEWIESRQPNSRLRHETYCNEVDSLLDLLTRVLVRPIEDARKLPGYWYRVADRVREGLYTYRSKTRDLGDSLDMFHRELSTFLGDSTIVGVQTFLGFHWAIGPPGLLVGDWLMPVLPSWGYNFMSTICLRPASASQGSQPQHLSRASDVEERYLRFFSHGGTSQIDCLHVTASLVGSACQLAASNPRTSGDYHRLILRVTKLAHKAAEKKKLPGPVVFDVVQDGYDGSEGLASPLGI